MPRKSIKDYREQGVKTPVIAYLLDKPYTYFPVIGIALLIMASILVAGFRDLEAMAADPVDDSPYQESEPRDFLGKQFAADLVSTHPDSIDEEDWTADEDPRQNSPLFSAEYCTDLEAIPNSMLTTYRGTGDGLQLDVFIFGAGQAKRYFEDAGSIIENCDDTDSYSDETITVSHEDSEDDYELDYYTFEHGDNEYNVLSAGDSIIQLETSDNGISGEDALEFYADYAVSSLNQQQWRCENIVYSYDDYTRSFYHDFESYEGFHETEQLEAETRTSDVPEPALTRNGNSEAEDSIQLVDYPNMQEPEAPLPEDFDDIPDSEPSRPEIPLEFEVESDFTDTAYYEIPDFAGPGCGWEWAAQSSPVYDEEALDHNREVVRTEVQNELEVSAAAYNESAFYYTLRVMNQEPVISRWNEYVNTVNGIHQDWEWLEEQRDLIWPDWANYLNEHEEWASFPEIQEEAQQEYNTEYQQYEQEYSRYEDEFDDYEEEYQQCLDERNAYDNWESQYGDAIREGDAVEEGNDPIVEEYDEDEEEYVEVELPTVPERPEDCSVLPTAPTAPSEPSRPSILDQSRGSEPQPPSIPEGVTVPESWDNPAQD